MKFEYYKIISYFSLLFFFTSLILSSIAIKDEMPWLIKRVSENIDIIEDLNLDSSHRYELQLQFTLKQIQSYAIDLTENEKKYHLGTCFFNIDSDTNIICGGPYKEKTYNIAKSVYYLNLSFIVFLIIMFVIEFNYFIFEIITRNPILSTQLPIKEKEVMVEGEEEINENGSVVSNNIQIIPNNNIIGNDISRIKNKLGFYIIVFRLFYELIGTILIYIATLIFAFKFPKTIDDDDSTATTLFAENGITLTFINCILTTCGWLLIFLAFGLYYYKLRKINKHRNKFNNNNSDKYSLLYYEDDNL